MEEFQEYNGSCICLRCGMVLPNRGGCQRCRHECPATGTEKSFQSSDDLIAHAQSGAEQLGVTWSDGVHYAMALARWTAAGWPTRTQDEVERIYQHHCKPCDNNRSGRCKLCRCRVNLGIALRNKIRMATEDCPAGKWSQQVTPPMIAVVGPNRSGTSCVAGMLHKLGVSMGRRFIRTTKENLAGYYEDMQLQRYLHKNYYWQPPAESAFAQHAAWFRNYAASRKEKPIVGCKHPLLCFALKEMSQAWPRLKIVATVRAAEDSTASLKRVGWYSKRRIPMDDFSRARDAAIDELKLPALYLAYHDVLRDPAAAVDRLVEFCGITPTADERAAAIAHVDPALCHVNPPAELRRQLVDVVYPLSNGSAWQDNELRYSLRSLEKFARNLGRVFVVGRKPSWLSGVVHIPARDKPRVNKDANIINKIRLAIAAGVSERFIFASDDQFLTAPVDLATLPVTHERISGKDKSRWWDRFYHTQKYLAGRGRPTLFYETHLFQPHTTQAFERACAEANYETNPGYTVNTLVYNSTPGISGVPASRVRGKLMRGYNDNGLNNGELKQKLSELFPQPSRFEMNNDNSERPRVFSFWTGPMPNLIKLCFESMKKNIPDIEIYDLDRWKSEYDGRLGPWEKIVCRKPNVQSDLLRYWLLATYGGIWLDADYIAFKDIRGIWDAGVDYIGYLERRGRDMPYTAVMGAPLGSKIVAEQCRLAKDMAANVYYIGLKAGPTLTRQAIANQPNSPVRMYPRYLFHPILWHTWINEGGQYEASEYVFSPDAYGMMLVHRVIDIYRGMSEQELLDDRSVIGQALRKALDVPFAPKYLPSISTCKPDMTPKSGMVEWNITYDCNLACVNCCRLCFLPAQTPPMTLEDAREFIRQCQEIQWTPRIISIIGGEPTLHPQLQEFCKIANELCPGKVNLWSNGYSEQSKKLLCEIRQSKLANIVTETHKPNGSIVQPINDIFISPADFGDNSRTPCKFHTSNSISCGISVDHGGYTVCPNGGAYDSVLGLGIRTQRLADLFDPDFAEKQTKALCRHCGMLSGTNYRINAEKCERIHNAKMSPTWAIATRKVTKND